MKEWSGGSAASIAAASSGSKRNLVGGQSTWESRVFYRSDCLNTSVHQMGSDWMTMRKEEAVRPALRRICEVAG